MIGFYSSKGSAYGTYLFSTPQGKCAEVTLVAHEPSNSCYVWPDTVCVGPVEQFIGFGKPSRLKLKLTDRQQRAASAQKRENSMT